MSTTKLPRQIRVATVDGPRLTTLWREANGLGITAGVGCGAHYGVTHLATGRKLTSLSFGQFGSAVDVLDAFAYLGPWERWGINGHPPTPEMGETVLLVAECILDAWYAGELP